MWRCLLILLVCAWSYVAPAQPLFKLHVSTRKVTCLGEHWIGTSGGCRDYQGGPVHLPGASVRAIDGDWLATDRGLFYQLRLVDGTPTTAVRETPLGLVTAHARGQVRFWRDGHSLACPTSAPIHSLAWDGEALWAASSEGLWRLSEDRIEAQRLSTNPISTTVTCVLATPGGLLVGTPAGIYRRHHGEWMRLKGSVLEVTSLAYERDRLYVGTAANGVFQGTLEGGLDAMLEGPQEITALQCTAAGLVVGTPQGAWRQGQWLYSTRDEITDNVITSVAAHEQRLWVGTFEDGVSEFDPQRGWRRLAGLPSGWINQLAWFGGELHVRFSDGSLVRGSQPVSKKQGLLKDWTSSLGEGWLGTLSGFSLHQNRRWRSFAPKPALQGVTVTAVLPEGPGRVWVGSQSGLFEVQPQTGVTRNILAELSDNWVTALALWGGQVCVGTFNGGLCVGRGTKWSRWPDLPSERVHCLLSTPRGLWIGTPQGLVWTDLRQSRRWTVRDGLPSDVIWALAWQGDRLFVGTQCGLAECQQSTLLK